MNYLDFIYLIFLAPSIVVLLVCLVEKKEPYNRSHFDYLPTVTVIISLRNEIDNIDRLLNDLSNMDYPKGKLQVLIGDDDSTDGTSEVLMRDNFQYDLVRFTEKRPDRTGKHFILKQLIKKAKGEVVLFTDADMHINPRWIKSMVSSLDSEGLVLCSGVTTVCGRNTWAKTQNLEWLLSQYQIKWLNVRGIYVTAWGNNMSALKSTLDRVNFQMIENSIVEDVALLDAVTKHGGSQIISIDHQVILETEAEGSMSQLINQRSRWMRGMRFSPVWIKFLFILKLLYLPVWLVSVFINPYFLWFFPLKTTLQFLLVRKVKKEWKVEASYFWICFYDLYELLVYFSSFVSYLISDHVSWKGRHHKDK